MRERAVGAKLGGVRRVGALGGVLLVGAVALFALAGWLFSRGAAARDSRAGAIKQRLCVTSDYSVQPGNSLNGVAVGSRSAAWAVGWAASGRSVIERWKGGTWRHVPGANPGGRYCTVLNAVAIAGPGEAWAVGYYSNGKDLKTLIERWNGRAWRRVPSPSPAGARTDSTLTGVAADGPSSAWAVGTTRHSTGPPRAGYGTSKTLIEHWDGRAWRRVPSPNPGGVHGGVSSLAGVAASGSSSAWAVGVYRPETNHRTYPKTLIEHWNGDVWKKVPSASPGCGSFLAAVAAAGPSEAWAVGNYCTGPVPQPLIERWNGRAWRQIASPGAPGSQGELDGVTAADAANAWAVGDYASKAHVNPSVMTLIEHWNGRAWKRVPSPSPGGSVPSSADQSILSATSAFSPSIAWAVGDYSAGNAAFTPLIERWTGKDWKATASQSP